MSITYSRWDGRQTIFAPDAETYIRELGENLLYSDGLKEALWKISREGITTPGKELAGNRGIFRRLQGLKQGLVERADSGSDGLPGGKIPDTPGVNGTGYTASIFEALAKIARLEEQLVEAQRNRLLSGIDTELVRELLGDEAAQGLESLRNARGALEEAGYLTSGASDCQLTPRGIRKIGELALREIFSQLVRGSDGRRRSEEPGWAGPVDRNIKRFEFGDRFSVQIMETLTNALYRRAQKPPLKIEPGDFEVLREEGQSSGATVLILDCSSSMPRRGNFQAAKRVAIALSELINTCFPKDRFYMVTVSTYARQIRRESLPYVNWDSDNPYTNLQHGLRLARELLHLDRCDSRQIIMVSDGDPTAHHEDDGSLFFQSPSSPRTLKATLDEARRCHREGIVINTFLLSSYETTDDFAREMTRLDKGRLFCTDAAHLGRYQLTSFLNNRISVLRRSI